MKKWLNLERKTAVGSKLHILYLQEISKQKGGFNGDKKWQNIPIVDQ